jgi:hypothetical protein
LVFDPRADGQGGDHDAQMGLDRLADVVIDGPGLQAMLGHSETLLDAPQLVILIDDELRGPVVRLVVYPPGQRSSFGLQLPVNALSRSSASAASPT